MILRSFIKMNLLFRIMDPLICKSPYLLIGYRGYSHILQQLEFRYIPEKSVHWKTIFFISHPEYLLWVLKRTVSMRCSFEHPWYMFKLMGEKIITIFMLIKICLSGSMLYPTLIGHTRTNLML